MPEENLPRQAWNLYRQGRFSTALELLEPKVFQFREDPVFFRVLGLCCLRLGDWKGGETYLQRSRQLDESVHKDVLSGLMAVAARRRDYGEAVRLGLELLDRDPEDAGAKKALDRVRAALTGPESGPSLDKETLLKWLPPARKPWPRAPRWFWWALGGLLAAALGTAGGALWLGSAPKAAPVVVREGPPGELPASAAETLTPGQDFAVTMTPEEIRASWKAAQEAFQAYQDSQARYQINRLLLSNAGPAVKQRARDLLPFLHQPDFARPEDSAPYAGVKAAPALWEGCTVRWTGVLANLKAGETKITFDLLLGYQDGQVVEGIVPVELNFAALLKNSQILEVLGRVALRDGRWVVEGVSLRDLGYRAP